MTNDSIIQQFKTAFSREIANYKTAKGSTTVRVKIIDNLPDKNERELLKLDLEDYLVGEGWNVIKVTVTVEQPAFVIITVELNL